MKAYKGRLLLSGFVILIPMFVGFFIWDKLPDLIPIHFDVSGTPDNYTDKIWGIFGLPVFLLFIHFICLFAVMNDPKKNNIGSKMFSFIFWIIPLISLVVNGSIIGFSMGLRIDISLITYLLIGITFIVLGNYMSKNRLNYTVGIRLPWTLNSEDNWVHTHRLASKLWVIGGLVILMNMFLQYYWLLFVVIIICSFIPTVYSFIYYKKHG